MTMPVLVADSLSAEWEQRFLRGSAAVGEEAITSDVLLALEERFAPYVKDVRSFSRAEEGGTHGEATGADFEVHFTTSDGTRHLGYRIQAKLAKRTRIVQYPYFDYDFNYAIAGSARQIDALISAAGNCVPLFFVYNCPDAVDELLFELRHAVPRFYWRWALDRGCGPSHQVALPTALTIGVLPAQVARTVARRSPTHLVKSAEVAEYVNPWSCLFHQHRPLPASRSTLASARLQLSMSQLINAAREQLDRTVRAAEASRADGFDFGDEFARMSERLNTASRIPEDVARLWSGDPDFDFDMLARGRARPEGDSATETWRDGDSQLGGLMVVEVAE